MFLTLPSNITENTTTINTSAESISTNGESKSQVKVEVNGEHYNVEASGANGIRVQVNTRSGQKPTIIIESDQVEEIKNKMTNILGDIKVIEEEIKKKPGELEKEGKKLADKIGPVLFDNINKIWRDLVNYLKLKFNL